MEPAQHPLLGNTPPGTRGAPGLTSVSPHGTGWAERGESYPREEGILGLCVRVLQAKPHREGPAGGSVLPTEVAGHLGPGGAHPVVGDTRWPWAPRPPACPGLGLEGGAGCRLGFLLSHAQEPLQPVCPSPHKAKLCPSLRGVWRGPDALPGVAWSQRADTLS